MRKLLKELLKELWEIIKQYNILLLLLLSKFIAVIVAYSTIGITLYYHFVRHEDAPNYCVVLTFIGFFALVSNWIFNFILKKQFKKEKHLFEDFLQDMPDSNQSL